MKRLLFEIAWIVIILATYFTAYNAGKIDAYLEMTLRHQQKVSKELDRR